MTLLTNQILVMQSRLGGNAVSLTLRLPCCSAVTVPPCLCMGNTAHRAWENCRLGKKPFLLGVGTGGKSTSQQQSHCWELVAAAQLIYLQPCKTITNFKCTWDLSPAKSPEFININQELLTVSVVALKHVGLKAFPQEILQRNWNEFPH